MRVVGLQVREYPQPLRAHQIDARVRCMSAAKREALLVVCMLAATAPLRHRSEDQAVLKALRIAYTTTAERLLSQVTSQPE